MHLLHHAHPLLRRGRAIGLGALILASALILSFRPIYEPDLWWHLAQGRENAEGRLVRTNVFSFAYSEYRQHYTSWLFDTLAYLSWNAGGAVAIQLVQASFLALTLLLLYGACRIRSPAWAAGVVLLIAVFVLEPRAIPRPHLVSFAGLAGCTLLIERATALRSARPLRWTVPLVAAWSNFHVECVFGVMLVGTFGAVEFMRPTSLTRTEARNVLSIAVVGAIATTANPYGGGLVRYLYENWSVPAILRIAELQPAPLIPYRAFYVYLLICAIAFAVQWRSVDSWRIVVSAAFAILGARYLRLTPLLLLASAPAVAAALTPVGKTPKRRRLIVGATIVIAFAVSRVPLHVLVTQLSAGLPAVAPNAFFSEDAIAFVRTIGLKGRVFNSHNLGGYLAWTLYPDVRIFQDSRLQAYPPEHFLSILVGSQSPADWDVLVADVDWAILSLPRPNQLSGVGRFRSDEWRSVFNDGVVEIVVRRPSELRLVDGDRERRPSDLSGAVDRPATHRRRADWKGRARPRQTVHLSIPIDLVRCRCRKRGEGAGL